MHSGLWLTRSSQTFGKGADSTHAARVKRDGLEAAATSYVADQLGLDDAKVKFRSGYAGGSSVHYGYIRQTHASSSASSKR